MYLSTLTIENFRCFGEGDNRFSMTLRPGLTALVGENDAGKTAVIDAIRLALGTTDQDWYRVEDDDFHAARRDETDSAGEPKRGSATIKIVCKFDDLKPNDHRAFLEYLTYEERPTDDEGGQHRGPVLYVNWMARDTGEQLRGRPYRKVEVCSGKHGDGPAFVPEVRELLRATYLRPLRDAEQALSAGRGSRLSQVLQRTPDIGTGEPFGEGLLLGDGRSLGDTLSELSIPGVLELANHLLEKHRTIVAAKDGIDGHLQELALVHENPSSAITVAGATASEDVRLRQILEKLDLDVEDIGRPGLGSSNLLFIACELLLLQQETEGNRMLLIEEPEAHLHPQRQLRVMRFLQDRTAGDPSKQGLPAHGAEETADEATEGAEVGEADPEQPETPKSGVQVIVTTHSPNLASVVNLDNMVLIREGRAYPLAHGDTKLDKSDYRFLERFLDVTKANLFFARAVMIVEGDAESILLPTLARLIGRDFTEHGVSIVNVGGTGLGRYARIFQRQRTDEGGELGIRVACLADMDVMPDCAPEILGLEDKKGRKWYTVLHYIAAGMSRAQASGEACHCVECIAEGVLRLACTADGASIPRPRARKHQHLLRLLEGTEARDVYRKLLDLCAVRCTPPREAQWGRCWIPRLEQVATAAAAAIAGKDVTLGAEAKDLLCWGDSQTGGVPDAVPEGRAANLYHHQCDEREVAIRLGSIHSVKGETHTATLALESSWHGHNLDSITERLFAGKPGSVKGVRKQARLKVHYVAMTRPTHLLCLAMRRDSFKDNELRKLEERGWRVQEL